MHKVSSDVLRCLWGDNRDLDSESLIKTHLMGLWLTVGMNGYTSSFNHWTMWTNQCNATPKPQAQPT